MTEGRLSFVMSPALSNVILWRKFPLTSALAAFGILLILWHVRAASFVHFPVSISISSKTHPINRRILEANNSYSALLHRQSKNLAQARREYGRRYQMAPPEGFDQWHAYATEHSSLIIDDFDIIHEKLQPFRAYLRGGCGLKEFDAKFLGDNHLLQICVMNGKLTYHGEEKAEWVQDAFKDMISDFIAKIPDICVLMNLLDEPRILLPRDKVEPNVTEKTFCPIPSFISFEKQAWWSEAILSCPPQSPARLYPGKVDSSRFGKLVSDFNSESDLCKYSAPVEHGMLLSPSSLLATHSVVPIISNAGLSTFADVFFPSIWRYDLYDEYKPDTDPPWERKENNAYWRGATTGGLAQSHKWEKFQRHRFVDYINNDSNGLGNMTDVKFSNIVQCEGDACDELNTHFKIDKKRPFSDIWNSKIVFDIDGNGLSGRFYPLLRSNSAVFRQSIFREWHDARIFPWIHYVPMSLEFSELKGLLAFFLGDGEVLLERLAKAGQDMANSVLRREDMKIYMYRLLVEMARKD